MSRRPPDPRSAEGLWNDQHQSLSTHSVPWTIKADELIRSFEIVVAQDESDLNYPMQVSSVAYMLAGYAIEVMLKAIIIQDGEGGTNANERRAPRSHDLIKLASDCGICLAEEELRLLERLREYIEWAGRYPVPTRSEVMQPRPLPNGGFAPITSHWAGEDWSPIRKLITALRSRLPTVTYSDQ